MSVAPTRLDAVEPRSPAPCPPRVRRHRVAALALVVAASVALVGPGLERSVAASQDRHLYRAVTLRAAPGSLATVIEMLRERIPVWASTRAAGPFLMRHSQGDHWDLMMLEHWGSFADYFDPDAAAARRAAAAASGTSDAEFEEAFLPHLAWREDHFAWGDPPEVVADRFDGAGFFHIEIFLAVAGKREELLRQRQMENVYLEGIGREPNLIFSRVAGAPWDAYTLGFYRDIKHFAESADIPEEVEERAAVAAGFESASTIGTYLRELIAEHHDTLATAVR